MDEVSEFESTLASLSSLMGISVNDLLLLAKECREKDEVVTPVDGFDDIVKSLVGEKMSNIVSVEEVGVEETYDLEVEHPDHQFYLSNGVLTSNSHAMSYAIDSYYCAWLLTYFEEEWLCAYLESMSGNDEKRAKAFSEVKALGYKIVNIDINYATKSWAILEGKRFMPSFLSCKGVGEAAVEEIMENRPYKSVEDMLWNEDGSWKHSKFNKRALEALIAIKAFDSLDCIGHDRTFMSHKQMSEILVNRNSDIKKHTKKNPTVGMEAFRAAIVETEDMDEWTRSEMVDNNIKYLGSFNAAMLMPDEILQKLESKGVKSVDDLSDSDIYWFIVSDAKPKKTKTGKPYLLLTITGLGGQNHRLFCWGWDGATEIPKYSVCISEISVDGYGNKTFMKKVKVLDS